MAVINKSLQFFYKPASNLLLTWQHCATHLQLFVSAKDCRSRAQWTKNPSCCKRVHLPLCLQSSSSFVRSRWSIRSQSSFRFPSSGQSSFRIFGNVCFSECFAVMYRVWWDFDAGNLLVTSTYTILYPSLVIWDIYRTF